MCSAWRTGSLGTPSAYRALVPQPRINPPTGPCSYLRHHQQFGLADPPVWRSNIPAAQQPLLEAAKVQHEFARHVLNQIDRLDLTRSQVAEQCGFSPETLNRYLRGASVLPLDRMLQIARLVALDIDITLKKTE